MSFTQKELLKGTLGPIILNLLANQKRMYGYEITQHIKELSSGKILIKEGSLYPALHKLESDGLLESEQIEVTGRVRKYYKLTKKGKKESVDAISELISFIETIHLIINNNKSTQYATI
ncbi:MAG: helix-turn-helix transcriptional regulator [Bacteroidia bacterium]|jgi:PadR family transcriptional regulator PadR|nr:helix-turn-helix transcriptional regulator [Bacteroidia bacterium]MBP9689168.1 helix-turn-helix transcriptional regulator [Bacteroidia bacterium]